MSQIRMQKISKQIERDVTDIIMNDVKDNKVGFITVTGAEVTNDLSFCKVYYSVLGGENRRDAATQALNRAKGFIRTELGKRLSIRKIPELIFVFDESIEYGNKIDHMLADLRRSGKF
ncbi:MAG TPA: 30S ribosome-binding factor RbfA [Firmicutes bacterium]|nr:30S ribosome-binding factor RbfA [Bacillota bacterium]